MFCYATNETDVLMPAPITYAHRLVQRQAEVSKYGTLPWLRPDAKSQVTFQYDDGKIFGIDSVLLSTQHSEEFLMFGYATNETDVLMPAPITYAHRLVQRQAEVRKNGTLPWLRPDAKSQVTFQYDDGKIVGIDAVVLSTQHSEEIDQKSLQEAVMEEIIKPILPAEWLTSATKFFINPTGRFVIGGPMGDCGLTGRKIIVDTYGGMARHGGGAFSGKDPSKVDRSAAYAARYVAKNIVAAGLADRCEIQVSYAIGVAEPTSIMVETFGTEKVPSEQLTLLVREFFDLRPYGLIQMLDLLHPIYKETAAYGHFGREHFPWEKTDKAQLLRDAAGLK